jgi:3-hydroxyisobutyrate dehydrogenase-like beta-hydroxyacid dehydrogenase
VYLGSKGLFKVPGGPRTSVFVDCTTVDPTTTRQLAASAGMLQLHASAAFLEGYSLRDGRPRLLDAPASGGVVGAGVGGVLGLRV